MIRLMCFLIALVVAVFVRASAVFGAAPALEGTVTDASGKVVAGVVVMLESLDGKERHSTNSGLAGKFHFDDVPAGRYSLSASEPNSFLSIYAPIAISENASLIRDVRLVRLPVDGQDQVSCEQSLVSGRVVGSLSEDPSLMSICLQGGGASACSHLARNGKYAIYVRPAKYEIVLKRSDSVQLLSHLIDVSFCGTYSNRIEILGSP